MDFHTAKTELKNPPKLSLRLLLLQTALMLPATVVLFYLFN